MKVYKAKRKGFFAYLIAGALLAPLMIILSSFNAFLEMPLLLIILFFPLVLLLWIYFDTFYKIEGGKLKYRSAFLRGEVEISKIYEIVKGKTLWVGIKPALATNGLIIKYNRFSEIYLAPENNDEMISDLLKINHNIKISE